VNPAAAVDRDFPKVKSITPVGRVKAGSTIDLLVNARDSGSGLDLANIHTMFAYATGAPIENPDEFWAGEYKRIAGIYTTGGLVPTGKPHQYALKMTVNSWVPEGDYQLDTFVISDNAFNTAKLEDMGGPGNLFSMRSSVPGKSNWELTDTPQVHFHVFH
jgi:hypothetical protein